MSHALDNAGHNCNLATEAESLVMTKEHLIERYGTLRYTIGTGCSGGSLAMQWIANAYPGIYQGILPTCSFPDAWSTASQFLDYHLSLRYSRQPVEVGRRCPWTPQQMADVQGHITLGNSEVSDAAQFHVVVPTDPCAGITDARTATTRRPTPAGCAARSRTRRSTSSARACAPSGVRRRSRSAAASPACPTDNVGVQYGLGALRSGTITPAQFVDLNAKIGGLESDASPRREAHGRGPAPLANAYRTGSSTRPTTSTARRSSTAADPTPARSTTRSARSRCAPGSTASTAATATS